jgi:predicted nucleic acid-binding protein
MLSSLTGHRAYLDTNIIIFAIEQGNPWTEILLRLFQAIDEHAVHAFTSELTIAEALTKPIALGAQDVIEEYNQVLAEDSMIKVVPIDRGILNSAAELRATLAVKLLDAIHLATAKVCACDFFLTDDEELGKKIAPELRWLQLSDLSEGR